MANEDEVPNEQVLDFPPSDDFGPVRERRDFEPLRVGLMPILPCPFREYKFTSRTGWRYCPDDVAFTDRLGISRGWSFTDNKMTPSIVDDASRKRIQDLDNLGTNNWMKRQRLDDPTVVSDDTPKPSLPDTSRQSTKVGTGTKSAATVVSSSSNSSSNNSSEKPSKESVATNSDIVPKAALYAIYGKKPRKTQLSGKDYLTWNNGARTHELKYTSVFVCPITKEVFLAGRYGDNFTQDGCLVWYSKKTLAEHAAAARVFDCYMFRDRVINPDRLGLDQPYEAGDQPILPLNQMPANVVENIQEHLKAAKEYQEKMEQQERIVPTVVRPRYSPPPAKAQKAQRIYGQVGNHLYRNDSSLPPPPPPPPQQQARIQNPHGRWDSVSYESRSWSRQPPPHPRGTSPRQWDQQYASQRGHQQQWDQQFADNRGQQQWDQQYSDPRNYQQNNFRQQPPPPPPPR